MKHQLCLKHLPFFLAFLFVFISCQEDPIQQEIDPLDEDMILATELAEEYLNSLTGRSNSDKSITVLKYKDGKLLYYTNTDGGGGYKEVTEETVTATVHPGEYVFWFSGGGVTDLDGIDFEDASQIPDEINPDMMWVIEVPDEYEIEDDGEEDSYYFKYDIVYQYKGNEGTPIRLDPKLKVTQ